MDFGGQTIMVSTSMPPLISCATFRKSMGCSLRKTTTKKNTFKYVGCIWEVEMKIMTQATQLRQATYTSAAGSVKGSFTGTGASSCKLFGNRVYWFRTLRARFGIN